MAKANAAVMFPPPAFFNPKNAEDYNYAPDVQKIMVEAEQFRKDHAIQPVRHSRVHLLVIDQQKDFCFPPPAGTLYVGGRSGRGAMEDSARIASFIYRNVGIIDDITLTMDTHFGYQIFYPSFWLDKSGNHPAPFTKIMGDHIRAGMYRVNPIMVAITGKSYAWLMAYAEYYADKVGGIELWTYHCMLGTPGHALVGVVDEARLFHSFVRGRQSILEVKGTHVLSEHYGVVQAEVSVDHEGNPLLGGERNGRFLRKMQEADVIIPVGEAGSHCLKRSTEQIIQYFKEQDPSLIKKICLPTDCTSAVAVPNPNGGFYSDFTDEMNAAFANFKNEGAHLVNSMDPMESWPGVDLSYLS